jgi:hypothetical protein
VTAGCHSSAPALAGAYSTFEVPNVIECEAAPRTVFPVGRRGAGPVPLPGAKVGDLVKVLQGGAKAGRESKGSDEVAGVFAPIVRQDGFLIQKHNRDLSGWAFIVQLTTPGE